MRRSGIRSSVLTRSGVSRMITVTIEHPTVRDPKSKAVVDGEPFIIARGYAGNIQAIESAVDIHKAMKARDTLANHSVKNGGVDNYRIFRTQDVRWRYK